MVGIVVLAQRPPPHNGGHCASARGPTPLSVLQSSGAPPGAGEWGRGGSAGGPPIGPPKPPSTPEANGGSGWGVARSACTMAPSPILGAIAQALGNNPRLAPTLLEAPRALKPLLVPMNFPVPNEFYRSLLVPMNFPDPLGPQPPEAPQSSGDSPAAGRKRRGDPVGPPWTPKYLPGECVCGGGVRGGEWTGVLAQWPPPHNGGHCASTREPTPFWPPNPLGAPRGPGEKGRGSGPECLHNGPIPIMGGHCASTRDQPPYRLSNPLGPPPRGVGEWERGRNVGGPPLSPLKPPSTPGGNGGLGGGWPGVLAQWPNPHNGGPLCKHSVPTTFWPPTHLGVRRAPGGGGRGEPGRIGPECLHNGPPPKWENHSASTRRPIP